MNQTWNFLLFKQAFILKNAQYFVFEQWKLVPVLQHWIASRLRSAALFSNSIANFWNNKEKKQFDIKGIFFQKFNIRKVWVVRSKQFFQLSNLLEYQKPLSKAAMDGKLQSKQSSNHYNQQTMSKDGRHFCGMIEGLSRELCGQIIKLVS